MGGFLTTFEHLFEHFIDHFCARRNEKGVEEHDRAPRGCTSRMRRPNSRPPRHNSGAHAALSQVAAYSSQRNSFLRLFLRIEMYSSTGRFRLMGSCCLASNFQTYPPITLGESNATKPKRRRPRPSRGLHSKTARRTSPARGKTTARISLPPAAKRRETCHFYPWQKRHDARLSSHGKTVRRIPLSPSEKRRPARLLYPRGRVRRCSSFKCETDTCV